MNPVDRTILEFCGEDFCAVTSLKPQIPSGTLYRHVTRLVRLGWLDKSGNLYRTTATGHRRLQRPSGAQPWEALEEIYPPLGSVPTAVHRALIELLFAAVVARQHAIRPDRHPYFVAFGSTLHWKTSLGRFVCHALGLDPTLHVVDCGSETGKSLSFRRNAMGDTVSRRNILDAPFLVLDEFLTADSSVRSTLNLFLSGRLVMPVENEQLTIKLVPLLTLNPKTKDTLEGRVGLSAPLIRRGIFADLDAVSMPDLAHVGEAAVEAARNHAPIVLGAPAADCHPFHDAIVALSRAILTPDARERVDVEILVSLSTSMTSLIPEPAGAITTVMHAIGITAETLGWVRPGWVELVANFTLASTVPAVRDAEPRVTAGDTTRSSGDETCLASPTIRLAPERRVAARRESMPPLDLSDELRRRLIWLAVETQQSVEEAMTILLDLYVEFRNLTNGKPPPAGSSLLGALVYHGLDAMDAAEKKEMRELVLRGGPWTAEEQAQLLAYCEEDVDALARLLPRMAARIDLPRALLRGRFMKAAARIEDCGVPVDTTALATLRAHWTGIQEHLIAGEPVREYLFALHPL